LEEKSITTPVMHPFEENFFSAQICPKPLQLLLQPALISSKKNQI